VSFPETSATLITMNIQEDQKSNPSFQYFLKTLEEMFGGPWQEVVLTKELIRAKLDQESLATKVWLN
jgi:hypothetical protein